MLDIGFKFMFMGLYLEKSGNNFCDYWKYVYGVYFNQVWY